VEFVAGSHRWNERFNPETFSGQAVYSEDLPPVPDIEGRRDELRILHFDLAPGDCTVHHALTVHGAPGNRSPRVRRRASISRWAGDDAVYHPREGIQDIPRDPGIPAGAPLRCELWPQVWPRA
jgi:ectoine hydroxylase-related dioxygenase (phytanoyl-CoA dioxygenase family)